MSDWTLPSTEPDGFALSLVLGNGLRAYACYEHVPVAQRLGHDPEWGKCAIMLVADSRESLRAQLAAALLEIERGDVGP